MFKSSFYPYKFFLWNNQFIDLIIRIKKIDVGDCSWWNISLSCNYLSYDINKTLKNILIHLLNTKTLYKTNAKITKIKEIIYYDQNRIKVTKKKNKYVYFTMRMLKTPKNWLIMVNR